MAAALDDSAEADLALNRTELRDRTFENRRYRTSGLNLVVDAIVFWNTVYLERAIGNRRPGAQHRLLRKRSVVQSLGNAFPKVISCGSVSSPLRSGRNHQHEGGGILPQRLATHSYSSNSSCI